MKKPPATLGRQQLASTHEHQTRLTSTEEIERERSLGSSRAASSMTGARVVDGRAFDARDAVTQEAPPLPNAVLAIDEGGCIVAFGAGAEAMFGWTAAEVLGHELALLMPQRSRHRHADHVRQFAATPSPRSMGEGRVLLGLRRNGEEFPLQIALSRSERGGVAVYTAVVRDCSVETRRAQEQDLLSELGASLLRGGISEVSVAQTVCDLAIFHNVADVCFVDIVDIVDGGDEAVPAAVHCDPLRQPLCDRWRAARVERHRPHLTREALRTGQPLLLQHVSVEALQMLTESEEQRAVLLALGVRSLIVVPLVARDRVLGAVTLLSSEAGRYATRDLFTASELAVRAAFALDNARLYRVAQQAVAARNRVLAIIAHDMRSPLTALSLQIAALDRPPPASERRTQKPVQLMSRAVHRMEKLIQDMLDIARLEAGELSVACAAIDVCDVVVEVVEEQQPVAARVPVALALEATTATRCQVWGQRDQLVRVLDNLIGNAMKFTPCGGRITVGVRADGDHALLWVSDTGRGIPQSELEHVFEQYWLAVRTDQRGVGMGLTIVKGIVEAHDGRVWVESQLGVGSTFFFTLPLAPTAATSPHA